MLLSVSLTDLALLIKSQIDKASDIVDKITDKIIERINKRGK